ncbi:branched-chain amino acid transporter permease [Leucobacter japonicus]|uniref:branched-chain amino acid transporter permease n=1 Tax=Leucobacter japonicus TaxID=1461259 RepID=UPI0006A77E43|nr:AzlD domain-containing protein [Leucobacter japonicus]
MPDTVFLIVAIATAGVITLALRALPFAVVQPLRRSRFIARLGTWMPAGILLILAVVVLRDQIVAAPERWWAVLVATAITVIVHLISRRRALVSIAAGTAAYILLVNFG